MSKLSSVPSDDSTPTTPKVINPCVCGHAQEAHEHFRSGNDCGACGSKNCNRFRPAMNILRRLLAA